MKKVLLIPPIINPSTIRRYENFMPLGLLTLAANARKSDFNVKIYNPKVRIKNNKGDLQQIASEILEFQPNLIGFSTWCITYPASLIIAKEIKSLSPKIPIVFGGPQASILAKETLQEFSFVDFVLSGESDFSFVDLLKEMEKPICDFSSIPGLFYRTKDGCINNNILHEYVKNLDVLPEPAYDLIPDLNWLKLETGRGCPFNCTYCSTNHFFSKKYRIKSVNKIINEIHKALSGKKNMSFSFAHDMITLNKKFIFELCNKLTKLKYETETKITWTCSARTDCVSSEMLIKMKEAGCTDIFFGIETGSKRMQQIIKKNLNIVQAYNIADSSLSSEINMHASFILGFPQETVQDLNQTLYCALILATKGALVQASELTLLPGTDIFKQYHNKLKFDGHFSNFSRIHCSSEERNLIKNKPHIFSSFYYLPVNTLERDEIVYLTYFINKSKHFRNTLFLLQDLIKNETDIKNLVQLFKNEYNKSKHKDKNNTIVLHWINVIVQFISINKSKINYCLIKDVFVYESYTALLKSIALKWMFIREKYRDISIKKNFHIKSTPIWKTITTSYKLNRIIPSENHWRKNNRTNSKGLYRYLLIAKSETKCKRILLNSKEESLLIKLADYKNLSFQEYAEKSKSLANEKETLSWLKKMHKYGVLEISDLNKNG